MYQELYHMLHLAQNFGFAPFLNKKFLKTLGDTKYICTFVLGTMNNCQPNKKESINISNLYKNLSNKLKLW